MDILTVPKFDVPVCMIDMLLILRKKIVAYLQASRKKATEKFAEKSFKAE